MNLTEWTQQIYDVFRARQTGRAHKKHYTREDVREILRTAIDILVAELEDGGDLALIDVGQLWVETRQPRLIQSRLHEQSTAYQVATRRTVRFRISDRLKKTLNLEMAEENR